MSPGQDLQIGTACYPIGQPDGRPDQRPRDGMKEHAMDGGGAPQADHTIIHREAQAMQRGKV
ncbi:MAG TPA: hypothetical protein VF909_08460, partial [Roseiflexaceae bacterium]